MIDVFWDNSGQGNDPKKYTCKAWSMTFSSIRGAVVFGSICLSVLLQDCKSKSKSFSLMWCWLPHSWRDLTRCIYCSYANWSVFSECSKKEDPQFNYLPLWLISKKAAGVHFRGRGGHQCLLQRTCDKIYPPKRDPKGEVGNNSPNRCSLLPWDFLWFRSFFLYISLRNPWGKSSDFTQLKICMTCSPWFSRWRDAEAKYIFCSPKNRFDTNTL